MGIAVIILAAGESKRILSSRSKVLHELCGLPLVEYPIRLAKSLQAKPVICVTPKFPNGLVDYLKKFPFVSPVPQNRADGTGGAVAVVEKVLSRFSGYVLILSGDVPLLDKSMVASFVKETIRKKAKIGLITTKVPNPKGYGRMIRDIGNQILKIVEDKNADAKELEINEINAGIYCVDKQWLFDSIKRITPNGKTREKYLTDLVSIAISEGREVFGFEGKNFQEFLGINTRQELAESGRLLQNQIVQKWLSRGVGFVDPRHVYIDYDVSLGEDTLIYPNVFLRGKTKIGKRCLIDTGSVLTDAVVAEEVHIKPYSVIEKSRIGKGGVVGPFSRLRPETNLKENVRVGNFVEVKKSILHQGTKANHLSYIGDATVGKETNIGCGTITCNYDGFQKHRTVLGEKVFVGSDVQFVAPVRVGKGAVIGAGSTITDNVPSYALALARGRQLNKKNWARRKKK